MDGGIGGSFRETEHGLVFGGTAQAAHEVTGHLLVDTVNIAYCERSVKRTFSSQKGGGAVAWHHEAERGRSDEVAVGRIAVAACGFRCLPFCRVAWRHVLGGDTLLAGNHDSDDN